MSYARTAIIATVVSITLVVCSVILPSMYFSSSSDAPTVIFTCETNGASWYELEMAGYAQVCTDHFGGKPVWPMEDRNGNPPRWARFAVGEDPPTIFRSPFPDMINTSSYCSIDMAAGFPLLCCRCSWYHDWDDYQLQGGLELRDSVRWTIAHRKRAIPCIPMVAPFIINIVCYEAIMLISVLTYRYCLIRSRVIRGRCVSCGYLLDATRPARLCSECGTTISGRVARL